ncbi:uncharacterized protein METZ01_LOCUS360046 [marine metagenome]|uniref:Uncharacterized protein n=1 Tax=marine metagenome TaxID=408172 RepID=A0A382SCA8_9ZZZZ
MNSANKAVSFIQIDSNACRTSGLAGICPGRIGEREDVRVPHQGSRRWVGYDLGILIRSTPGISVGLVGQNTTGKSTGILGQVRLVVWLSLASRQQSRSICRREGERQRMREVGVEYRLNESGRLRLGIGGQSERLTVGFGVTKLGAETDYGILNDTVLELSHRLTLS